MLLQLLIELGPRGEGEGTGLGPGVGVGCRGESKRWRTRNQSCCTNQGTGRRR